MSEQEYRYILHAVLRDDQGKGASRRLRREGWVPAVVYGGDKAPQAVAIKQDELIKNAKHDSFFSQIIYLKIEGEEDSEVIVRDVQHHVYKPLFQHFDFQRIIRGEDINATVPLRFINEETSPGVKTEGGIVTHYINSIDIACLPQYLPEYIEVDLGKARLGDVIHLKDIPLPHGVRFDSQWTEEVLAETAVVQIVHPQREEETTDTTSTEGDISSDSTK